MKVRELFQNWHGRSWLWLGLAGTYGVMWAGGIAHYVIMGRPPLDAPWAAALFLLLAGVLAGGAAAPQDRLSLGCAALLGFLSEIHGVKYGVIFGPYLYTEVLQPQLLGVPLVMFSAWLVLLTYTRQMLLPLGLPHWGESLLASGWMTAIDLVIDPLAAHQLGYWRWAQSGAYYGIPLHNFLGWFGVSWLIFSLVRRRWQPNLWARWVGLSITIFFTVIALCFGLWVAGAVGLALCGLHAWLVLNVGSSHQKSRTHPVTLPAR